MTSKNLRVLHICRSGHGIWRSLCPLICFDIVESHLPYRVMCQFDLEQVIPDAVTPNLHYMRLIGGLGTRTTLYDIDRKQMRVMTEHLYWFRERTTPVRALVRTCIGTGVSPYYASRTPNLHSQDHITILHLRYWYVFF